MPWNLFRSSFSVDETYLPVFVGSLQAALAHAAYDYTTELEAIVASSDAANTSIERVVQCLIERNTPYADLVRARANLRERKPTDRRFATNLHRRLIRLIDWQEREFTSVLALMAIPMDDLTDAGNRRYAKTRRWSQTTSERVNNYARKITEEIVFLYERYPDLRAALEPLLNPA